MAGNFKAQERYKRFAKEYVLHMFDGAKAAIAAGYSPKTARVQASQLLTRPNVQEFIQAEVQRLNKNLDIQQDELLASAKAAAMLDITDVLDISGKSVTVKDLSKLPVEVRRTIQEIEEKEHGLKIKFESRSQARDFIARVKGWYQSQPFTGGAKLVFMNLGDDSIR